MEYSGSEIRMLRKISSPEPAGNVRKASETKKNNGLYNNLFQSVFPIFWPLDGGMEYSGPEIRILRKISSPEPAGNVREASGSRQNVHFFSRLFSRIVLGSFSKFLGSGFQIQHFLPSWGGNFAQNPNFGSNIEDSGVQGPKFRKTSGKKSGTFPEKSREIPYMVPYKAL